MREKLVRLKRLMAIVVAVQLGILLLLAFVLEQNIVGALIILITEGAFIYYLFDSFEDIYEEQSSGVRSILGSSSQEAFLTGGIGLVIYDDQYRITWMSDLFQQRGIDRVGDRLTAWVPEVGNLLSGDQDTCMVVLDQRVYEIRRKEDAPIMLFRDITEITAYKTRCEQEQVVIGMASFDNYDESIQFADEAEAANINVAVRTPLMEYCQAHGILMKRVTNSRYLLVLNEKIFQEVAGDHFSVLAKVRKAAQKQEVSITLSMAFARGTGDFEELDNMTSTLMDLAQTRGGDQVAVQSSGGEVHYFGGSSEAAEKRSRVRVRVMSNTLRGLIMNSSNVIIACHKNADFDCMGSALALSRMVQALRKPVCIIAKTGGIEEKLGAAMLAHKQELQDEVSFVTESEALNQLRNDTLVIMTDHHNVSQSNGARVEEAAKKVVVIDHHRRSTDMGVKPVLVYIEAGASSASELVTEMIPYVSTKTDLSELDATFMLTGMTIDTDHWHVRTGARTFDAASALRKYGADPQMSNEWLKDTYSEFALKSSVIACAKQYEPGILIAAYDSQKMTRSLMSQAADSLLEIQGVQAAFVVADDDHGQTCISARSAGKINVQLIMEKMNGGGHMTAAAVQRRNTSVAALEKELEMALGEYQKEEESDDEGNS